MKAHIPNTLTCCNLLCGCIAVTLALRGAFLCALIFMLLGAVFDFADGFVARLLGVSSPIGKELDSLADSVTFGVAPAAFLYVSLLPALPRGGAYVAFLLAACSALRLAKFNLDTRQTTSFIGLPTPANALFWASLLTAYGAPLASSIGGAIALLVLLAVSCYLLLAEVPMFAMKFKSWGLHDEGNAIKYTFLAIAIVIVALAAVMGDVVASIAVIVVAYVLLSLLVWRKTK